ELPFVLDAVEAFRSAASGKFSSRGCVRRVGYSPGSSRPVKGRAAGGVGHGPLDNRRLAREERSARILAVPSRHLSHAGRRSGGRAPAGSGRDAWGDGGATEAGSRAPRLSARSGQADAFLPQYAAAGTFPALSSLGADGGSVHPVPRR